MKEYWASITRSYDNSWMYFSITYVEVAPNGWIAHESQAQEAPALID